MSPRPEEPVLLLVARRTVTALEDLIAEKGLQRDHLSKGFHAALAGELPAAGFRPALSGERKCHFPAHFPRAEKVRTRFRAAFRGYEELGDPRLARVEPATAADYPWPPFVSPAEQTAAGERRRLRGR